MIRDKFVHYGNSSLHYAKTGNGNKHLLLFHGFGQSIEVFDSFARSLASHYTFYIFDLYFHGKSRWNNGEEPLNKAHWKAILNRFFEENGMARFSVGGFSLGGKFALATLEAFPDRIDHIFLLAPDGIRTSFWYNMATYPVVLRRLFKSMILHPDRFLRLTRFLFTTRLVDHGLIRFAEFQMNSEEKRRRVYYSWVVFRHLSFNPRRLAALINGHNIALTLIVGRYDKVIQPHQMKKFLRRVKGYRFEVLDSGHTGLINLSLEFFAG